MKKYFIATLFFILPIAVYAQNAPYTPWYASGKADANAMYRNLEKYWWYRYRLVNDFMKIGTGCGESIPMERWEFQSKWYGQRLASNDQLFWGDATQHLGNYINMLVGEWWLLNTAQLNTRRTEEELYYALYAMERLDKKAEPSWRDYDAVYPYCEGSALEQAGDINGFFIRNDVPSIQLYDNIDNVIYPNFATINSQHFHRPGFFYNSPIIDMEESFGKDANIMPPLHPAANQSPTGYRGPDEESQDQMVMLYAGLGMASYMLPPTLSYNGWNLKDQAQLQLYRMYNYAGAHGCSGLIPYRVCNPIDSKCVGSRQNPNCNKGGGQIEFNAVGAIEGLQHVGYPPLSVLSANQLNSIGYLSSVANAITLWPVVYQAQQSVAPTGSTADLFYSNTYAAFADNWGLYASFKFGPFSWSQKLVNTTEKKLVKHSTSNDFCWPQLPLMYQLVNGWGPGTTVKFNPDDYNASSYPKLFNDAPFCGCHSYAANQPYFRSNINFSSFGHNEDYPNQNAWQWSSANRLQDFNKRGNIYSTSDFNNLDYMTLWNLYAMVEGTHAIPLMFNPYYREDFNFSAGVNFTFFSFATHSHPLKLNFLEYLSMINKVLPNGDLRVRCGKVIDLKPGFEAQYSGTFEAVAKDYRCQEEGFVHALGKGGSGIMPLRTTEDSSGNNDNTSIWPDADGFSPLAFAPDGVAWDIPIDSERIYRIMESEKDSVTVEEETIWLDSVVSVICSSGDSSAIVAIQPVLDAYYGGVCPPPSGMPRLVAHNAPIAVFPNPCNGLFYITTDASFGIYNLEIYNNMGQKIYDEARINRDSKQIQLEDKIPSGTYSLRITSASHQQIFKLTLIK